MLQKFKLWDCTNLEIIGTLYQFTLFPTATVLPSGLQHIFIFSPLVFTTDTHLLAVNENITNLIWQLGNDHQTLTCIDLSCCRV